jgi:hypothetical protein
MKDALEEALNPSFETPWPLPKLVAPLIGQAISTANAYPLETRRRHTVHAAREVRELVSCTTAPQHSRRPGRQVRSWTMSRRADR